MRAVMLLPGLALLLSVALAQEAPPADDYKPSVPGPQTDLLLRMFRTGKQKLPFWCQVHKDPKVGQRWVVRSVNTAGGAEQELFSAWQVVKVDGDLATVEYDNGRGFIAAFEVDLTKKPEDIANVKRAWVAKPGEKPETATVMDAPKPPPGETKTPDAPEKEKPDEPKVEEFKDLELAGRKWSGKLVTTRHGAWETRTWTVEGAWFGGVIKTVTVSGKTQATTELHRVSTTAKAWLKWEEAEKPAPKNE